MVRLVEARGTARCAQDGPCGDNVQHRFVDTDRVRPRNPVVPDDIIEDIDVIEDRHAGQGGNGPRQNGLDVFPVDLDVPVAAGRIVPVFVLQDGEPQALHPRNRAVQPARHGQQQVFADDSPGVGPGVIHIVLRGAPGDDIRIDGIDARRQAAAAPDIGLFGDQHAAPGYVAEREGGVAARRSSADNQKIRGNLSYCNRFLIHPVLASLRNSVIVDLSSIILREIGKIHGKLRNRFTDRQTMF